MAAKRPHADNDDAEDRALPKRRLGTVQAVLVDFDATLTVREEIPAWRLFPEKGGFDREVDVSWLRERGFGGEERIRGLEKMFRRLDEADVELHVVSWADRDVIERALSLLGLLTHFKTIAGVQQLGQHSGKAAFIQNLISERSLKRNQVLFIDDQQKNVDAVAEVCLTHKTRGRGLTTTEMDSIVQQDFKSGNAPEKIQIACASKSTRSASTEHSDRTTSGTSQVAELDEIERRVSHLVQSLCEEDAAALVVCHVKGNMYKINGRRVRLSLSRRAAVMVQEDFDALPLVPLETYLQQAVFVSRALHGLSIGSPAVAQVPANRRLTFAAIDAADAESSRRVKAPPYAQLAVQLAASPVDVGTD
ncbi:unnamed protein product [Symbiodinium sp. KB8]|nr:unnamed protein product [Symbiodinium sp. KB8]